MKKKRKIKKSERFEIADMLEKEYGKRRIARALDRSPGSICDEIRRNSVRGVYDPEKAHEKARQRKKKSKYQSMKIVGNDALRRYIHEKIFLGWSPELVSGRIREGDRHITDISWKAVYKYVHTVYGRLLEMHLPRYGKRKKRSRTPVLKLEGRVFIDQRPKIVAERKRFGDWEGDFIVSGKKGTGYLLVLRERKSRYVLIRKILCYNMEEVYRLIFEITGGVVMNTLTLDNDVVFRRHKELSELLGVPVYFCHPYHSWEKGGVENVNGVIRRWIPKGADISQYTDEYIEWIESKLNDRPMECLKFRTPREVMERRKQFREFKTKVESSMLLSKANVPVFGLRG